MTSDPMSSSTAHRTTRASSGRAWALVVIGLVAAVGVGSSVSPAAAQATPGEATYTRAADMPLRDASDDALGGPADEGEDAPAESATCGRPGLPPCPLQQWMRKNLAKPLAANDLATVAASFDRLEKLAPETGWTSWATFAKEGAAAARDGDVAAARKACSGCHAEWRSTYRKRHRARPVPGA